MSKLLYYYTAFHYQPHLAQGLYVLGWVAGHGHEVGEQAGRQAAAVSKVEGAGIAAGGGPQYF